MKCDLHIKTKAGILKVAYPSGIKARQVQAALSRVGLKSEVRRAISK